MSGIQAVCKPLGGAVLAKLGSEQNPGVLTKMLEPSSDSTVAEMLDNALQGFPSVLDSGHIRVVSYELLNHY